MLASDHGQLANLMMQSVLQREQSMKLVGAMCMICEGVDHTSSYSYNILPLSYLDPNRSSFAQFEVYG